MRKVGVEKSHHSRLPGNDEGFTLIEILIVMLIMSIVSGIAILMISSNTQKQIEYSAKALTRALTLASEEAILRPGTLGAAFTENSYEFFIYQEPKVEDDNPWKPLPGKTFRKHFFPKKAVISLKVQDQTVELNGAPQVIIAENGNFTPFTLTIWDAEKPLYQISGNTSGEVTNESLHEK
jgi:general secretion pathway protein H